MREGVVKDGRTLMTLELFPVSVEESPLLVSKGPDREGTAPAPPPPPPPPPPVDEGSDDGPSCDTWIGEWEGAV